MHHHGLNQVSRRNLYINCQFCTLHQINPNLPQQTQSCSQMYPASPVNPNLIKQTQPKSQIWSPKPCPPSHLYDGYYYNSKNKKSQDHSNVPTVNIPSRYERKYFISGLPNNDLKQKSVIDLSAASVCPIYSEIALARNYDKPDIDWWDQPFVNIDKESNEWTPNYDTVNNKYHFKKRQQATMLLIDMLLIVIFKNRIRNDDY